MYCKYNNIVQTLQIQMPNAALSSNKIHIFRYWCILVYMLLQITKTCRFDFHDMTVIKLVNVLLKIVRGL